MSHTPRSGGCGVGQPRCACMALTSRPTKLIVSTIVVFFRHPHLLECAAKIRPAKVLILVVVQPVLVVEMDAAKFVVCQDRSHPITGIQPHKQSMSAFDQSLHPAVAVRSVRGPTA